MPKRFIYGSGILLLIFFTTLLIWQGSFSFGQFSPANPEQTYFVWAVSTLIFLLTVTLAFMLIRNFVKLYVERHSNREGSRIRTKLVLGALALSFMPVFFFVIFSVSVLNFNITRWFSRPAEDIKLNLVQTSEAIERESRQKARAQVDWMAALEQVHAAARQEAPPDKTFFQRLCNERSIDEVRIVRSDAVVMHLCDPHPRSDEDLKVITVEARLPSAGTVESRLVLRSHVPLDLATTQKEINQAIAEYDQLAVDRKTTRRSYLQLLALITLFILFIATWIALFLAKQISIPISALLGAAQQVRGGNLGYRVSVGANDELASLVRAFNEMTQDLESNARELENRRRFTEAILESIPTGVISLSSDGRIQRVNRALKGILPAEQVDRAVRLEHLFAPEDMSEIRYLMNRARRMGLAASQFELRTEHKVLHLSATVAALDEKVTSGFVLVLEDTSDLLRAQKAAAWHEVARRIAHEIKNPLTPIGLSSERIARQLDRIQSSETDRILRECAATISTEVASLKQLVDEFSQFARFPAAQPAASDLNEVVENALVVFQGRLLGIELIKELAPGLPGVNIDREQFKRVVINLVDNAAEAMDQSLVKRLYIRTAAPTPDTVELTVADTGCGVSPEDKEKLFLPFFSTKGRGTGLGLAIVNHILSDHDAQIRVEDNSPVGARFIIDLPTLAPSETDASPLEMPA
ncbi:MAG TPA: ATP-binding protein [Bryobacteraceae bacterium]|nr:ATP-binding protein [Bryobacteraceae bacterium]